jgi:hypothetical protein
MKSNLCTIEGCDKVKRAKGLCSSHYNKTHPPIPKECFTEGCAKITSLGRFCNSCRNLKILNDNHRQRCSVDGCNTAARTKNYCATHYHRYRRTGDLLCTRRKIVNKGLKCSVNDCDTNARSMGMCKKHYARSLRNGSPLAFKKRMPSIIPRCAHLGCKKTQFSNGLCFVHHFDNKIENYSISTNELKDML